MNGDAVPDISAIRGRVISGVGWKAASQFVLHLSRLVVALVLARLLAPNDWGLAAMVLVFSGVFVVFTDNALGTALIQRPRLLPADRSTVFWISATLGGLITVLGAAAAGPLAAFYGEPAVEPLFTVLSLTFFVSALRTTHVALLVREMRFKSLELAQIAATIVGASVGLTLAVADFGAWAIVGQQLGEAVTLTAVLFVVTPWRPSFSFSWASVRRLGGFAGNVFAENLLYQTGRNASSFLIGRFLGPAAVGMYALSTNVILMPFSRIAAPLQAVFFPAFSRLSDAPEKIADVWIRATRLVAAISVPALVGLVMVAPDLVAAVLGPDWSAATPVIQILAWVGIAQSLQTLTPEVLLALGRAGTALALTATWFVATIAAFVVGIRWGIVGVAASQAVATTLVEPLRTYVAARAIGIGLRPFARALSGIVQATIVMAVAVAAARVTMIETGVPTTPRLLLSVLTGVGVYVIVARWRAPEIGGEIRNILSRRRGAEPPATARAAQALVNG